MRDALFQAESRNDLCVQIQDPLPEIIVNDSGEDTAFGGKRVGQVKIERVPDTQIAELVIHCQAFHQELAPGSKALDENAVVRGPACGFGIF